MTSYLPLLRKATSNYDLSNENRRMLSNLPCESEEFIQEPEDAMTDKVHHDELNLLHEICDGDIAFHSVELAIQVCCDLTHQSRAQVLRPPHEIKSQWQTLLPSELYNQGIGLRKRFEKLGHISDLENAVAMQRKAIIPTPFYNANRPKMLSNLRTLYRRRYDRFGDVKDIDSVIRQQFLAIASTSEKMSFIYLPPGI